MPILNFNSHNLYVEDHGDPTSPAVILLHHGLGSARAWKEQIPALTEAGYRVVVYDRWGYGRSAPRPALDLPTFSADVADLREMLATLGIARAALVGHSDGGTLALYYAARYPEQVSCLVTVAAHIYHEPSLVPGIEAVRQSFETDDRFRQAIQHVHGGQVEAVFNNWYQGWRKLEGQEWDMRPELRRITCPALVIQGCLDEHATPQHAMDIAANIQGAELWMVEGARHMLPQESAAIFNPRLLQFLKAKS
jgi:pimeloyl-ACP methyl ester carboxylesterase